MSLANPGTESIIVSTFPVDGAAVNTATVGETGFPVSNVLDPQPSVRWRVDTSGGATTPSIVLDLRTGIGQSNNQFTPAYDYFGIYFHNAFSGIVDPGSTWRIRVADTVTGTTTAPNFDSGTLDLWPSIAAATDRGTFKDSEMYFPPGVTSHHYETAQSFGGGTSGQSDDDRFVRIDFDVPDQFNVGSHFEVGRIVIGKAIRVLVPAPGERPTPVGTPARPVVTWDAVMNRARYEEFMYTLARDRGSSPRLLRSWGHDVFPLDGAGTVAAIQDVEAADPWTRHQGTVYGYLESVMPVSVRGDMHRFRVTFRSL